MSALFLLQRLFLERFQRFVAGLLMQETRLSAEYVRCILDINSPVRTVAELQINGGDS